MNYEIEIGRPCEGATGISLIDNFVNGSGGAILMIAALICAFVPLLLFRKRIHIQFTFILPGLAAAFFLLRTLAVCFP